ncbi:unnamed protein product [Hymenolepis diminuta]|uniref:CUE domain-containing protein n=2 Tax=Hymenolepis diminuta TaxID=6216 RepID=A0A0R3SVT9_HYMDI|nr:unnamed protein product [Hymenolepis diminuta]
MSADNLVMNAGKSKTAQRGALNAPKATPEQIRLAKLLNNSNSEHTEELQFKLQQVSECTASSIETAFSALRDADNDVQVAIELILDGNCEDSWMDPFAKKTKAKKQHEQKSKVKKGKEQPKTGSNQSLNDKKSGTNADIPKKPARQDGIKKGARQVNQAKNGSNKRPRKPHTELPLGDGWTVECDEWKGETIEVVNSCVDSPVNIQEDSDLLKLVTTQDVELPAEQSVKEEETKASVEKHEEPVKEVKEQQTVQEESTSEVIDAVQSAKARLFSTYTQSVTPPSSVHSQLPVFFAPGSTVFPLRDEASSIQFGTNYVSSPNFNSNIFAGQDLSKSRSVAASVQQKSARTEPAQETFTPTIPPHVTPVAPIIQPDQAFTSAPLQQPNVSASVQKESFSKIQESQTQGAHPQQSQTVNNFDNPYNYNLLGELSQNMKNVDLQDMQVGKSDAFTQSASSTQPDNMPTASYQFPASKLSVGGMPQQGQQINKPISIIPPNTGPQQSMPTTQAAPLPQTFMHYPHVMSHLQQNMPFFNFPQPPATSTPTMFDLDHLQAFQQRMLYEMQSHASAPAQTVANDNSNSNVSNAADVMASNKPTNMPQPPQPPIHQVTTTNSGYFVPYGLNSGMVLMNSYPNTFVSQQQQQAPAAQQSQNPSTGPHGASPLSHTGNNQFAKPISAPTNFSAYQNVRQANFEEVNDIFYPNLSKQMSFKQGYYNAPKPDMGNKLQQQAGGMSPSQQGGPSSQVQQQQSGSNQVQPPNIYSQQGQGQYPFYQAQAIVAAAVAAQNQQPNQANQSTGGATGQGPSGMVPLHGRPTH